MADQRESSSNLEILDFVFTPGSFCRARKAVKREGGRNIPLGKVLFYEALRLGVYLTSATALRYIDIVSNS